MPEAAFTLSDLDAFVTPPMPPGLGPPPDVVVFDAYPLTDQHIVDANTHHVPAVQSNIKHLRHTHHRLAMMLANGTPPFLASKLCNFSISRVERMQADPAFVELMSHYAGVVEEEWADFVQTAAVLSMDVLQEIQRRLDENPEAVSLSSLVELTKLLADRSGNGAMTKSVNLNINSDVALRLNSARARLQAVPGPQSSEEPSVNGPQSPVNSPQSPVIEGKVL